MNIVYRDTKEVDYEQLLRLQLNAPWCKHRTHDGLRKAIANSQLLITGWSGTELIACTRVLTDYVYRAVVFDVIVHPDFQGKGIGREILKQVTEHPSLQNVEYFFLYTQDKQEFYRKIGWEVYSGSTFRLMGKLKPKTPVE